MEDRDTVPAMPVPSRNPIAEERKEHEAQLRETRVAILCESSAATGKDTYVGVTIDTDGVANRCTIQVDGAKAHEWLLAARKRLRAGGTWIPSICSRCLSIRTTPSLCEVCLRKR